MADSSLLGSEGWAGRRIGRRRPGIHWSRWSMHVLGWCLSQPTLAYLEVT